MAQVSGLQYCHVIKHNMQKYMFSLVEILIILQLEKFLENLERKCFSQLLLFTTTIPVEIPLFTVMVGLR